MDATKCLNSIQWEQYAHQSLSATENAMLLQHVVHCEVCLDIKEGIDQLKNSATLVQTVERINARIDAKLAPPKSKVIPIYFWLSTAAVFIVILGVVFFPLPQAKDTAVLQIDLDNNKAQLPSSDAKINTYEKEVLVQPAIEKPQNKPKQEIPSVKLQTAPLEELPAPTIISEPETEDVPAPVQEEVKALKQMSVSAKAFESKKQRMILPLSVSAKAFESKKQRMILPSNNMNNRNAEQELNLDMNVSDNGIDSTNFKLALELIAQKDYSLALEKLQLLSTDKCFKAEALWLQADIYAKKGDLLAQREALRKLIQLNGKYKKEAELLLKD